MELNTVPLLLLGLPVGCGCCDAVDFPPCPGELFFFSTPLLTPRVLGLEPCLGWVGWCGLALLLALVVVVVELEGKAGTAAGAEDADGWYPGGM